jgi:hypothetical protein
MMNDENLRGFIGEIIEINCIDCPEFYKDTQESDCICESLDDVICREAERCVSEDAVAACWEAIREEMLENMSPEQREQVVAEITEE